MARGVRRGDVVTVIPPGAYGKPRPAVVIQSDWLDDTDSVIVGLMTSTIYDTPIYRLTVQPTPGNGLRTTSQVMVDKLIALPRSRCGAVIGHLERDAMITLNRMLTLVLGIID